MTELMVVDNQEGLPLRFERSFRPWLYEVSHRRLVLRSYVSGDEIELIDIEFLDVLGMKIRHGYEELSISEVGDSIEIDDFVDVPERHKARYRKLIVSDGLRDGCIV